MSHPDNAAWPRLRRVRTPTVLQLEAAECGPATLAMILGHFGRRVPLEELREACGVSRDGSKAGNILRAARRYGLVADGYRKEPETLGDLELPLILFWNFNHFVVLEKLGPDGAILNDPALGHRRVDAAEFQTSFTGVALAFRPGPEFQRGGRRPGVAAALAGRLSGAHSGLALILLASAGLILPALLVPAFTRLFVDYVLIQRLDDWLPPLVLAMCAVAAVRAGLVYVQQQGLARMRGFLALRGAGRFVWHVLRLPVGYFSQRYPVEIAYRNGLNDRLADLLARDLATAVLNALAVIVFAAVMVQYDVVLTGVSAAMALINLAALWLVARSTVELNQRLQMDDGLVGAATVQGFSMLDSLKATGTESRFLAQWTGRHARVLNAEQSLGRLHVFVRCVPFGLSVLGSIVIVIVGGLRVMDGAITIGMLLGFQALATMFAQPITRLVQFGAQIQEVRADLERLDDVVRQRLDPGFAQPDGEPAAEAGRLPGILRVEGLRYGYRPLDPPLIDGLSLDLRPGFRIALVGGSGSGKSTIGKLIAGLYHPWSGEILLDGRPITMLPRMTLRHSIAFVDQEAALFPGSVRDNISLWDPTLSDDRVIAAARDAHIHAEIAARPLGYDTPVDEGGRNFSGGQRQRIILARALALDPSLLILDEATSALDAQTEFAFMETLRRRGCSCIIIAHRLSTIRDCDEIIVIDRGRIAERGRHDDLLRMDGLYRALLES